MSALLQSAKVQKHNFAIATLDDLLGAIYAFALAFHNQPAFKYRPVADLDGTELLLTARLPEVDLIESVQTRQELEPIAIRDPDEEAHVLC